MTKDQLNDLSTGSLRERTLKALRKYPDGLTVQEIKKRLGLPIRGSGAMQKNLNKDVERGWVAQQEVDDGRRIQVVYTITKRGKEKLNNGEVDERSSAGKRVGINFRNKKRTPVDDQ